MEKIINVKILNKSYSILIGKNYLKKIKLLFKEKNLSQNIFIVVDKNVYKYHKDYINRSFEFAKKLQLVIIDSTEKNKNLMTVEKIYSELIKNNFGRDTTIVGIGGGLIGDIAAYVASSYMRGISFVNIPTTLLAAVDASIGGKTGVNFSNIKNIIGTFYQPDLVLNDSVFLSSLPEEEYLSGLGEVLKYKFITHKSFADSALLKNNVQELIGLSASVKANIVMLDEKELSLRKVLNLGHTFAHAFESVLDFKIKHGVAVAAGITAASYLSRLENLISEKKLIEFLNEISKFNIHPQLKNVDEEEVYSLMLSDKKNRDEKIKFVLPIDFGKIILDYEAAKINVINSIKLVKFFFGPV